jgi:Nuclease-related domain
MSHTALQDYDRGCILRVINFPSYTGRQAQKSVRILLTCLVILIISWFLRESRLGAMLYIGAVITLFALRKPFTALYKTWIRGYAGEQQVASMLSALPDSYTLVTAFAVPDAMQGDTDAILLGPHGLLVIEVKTYEGQIEFESGKWYRRHTSKYRSVLKSNPSQQVLRNAQSLVQFVTESMASMPPQQQFPIPVHACVVFCETDKLTLIDNPRIHVIMARDLLPLVNSLQPVLTVPQIASIALLFNSTRRMAPPLRSH